MKKQPETPIARLDGVIEPSVENGACALVFELKTDDGNIVHLTYGELIEALSFAQEEGIIPTLSAHWWARIRREDGCAF